MKLLIIGHARSGKDTAAEYLRDNFGITFESSSMAAARIFLFDQLKHKYKYKTIKECFEDRIHHRKEWYDLICEYNEQDKLRLAKEILKESDMYVGMRSRKEVLEAKKQGLFDLILWIDGGDRVQKESSESMTVTKGDAHIVIMNDKDISFMYDSLDRIGQMILAYDKISVLTRLFGDHFKPSHLFNSNRKKI